MVFIALAAALFLAVADQLIKLLVINTVKLDGGFSLLGGIVDILYVENRGIAFGMMENFRWLFIIITALLMIFIVVFLIVKKPKSKLLLAACSLIIGGGIGNLIDRVFLGYVVDYIQLSFFPPVCNFADYCVTFGTVMLVIYMFFFSNFLKDDKKKLADKHGTV